MLTLSAVRYLPVVFKRPREKVRIEAHRDNIFRRRYYRGGSNSLPAAVAVGGANIAYEASHLQPDDRGRIGVGLGSAARDPDPMHGVVSAGPRNPRDRGASDRNRDYNSPGLEPFA